MAASHGGGGEATQKALQAVAQTTRWTYSLLWQLCPHQGALVWAEGHYNGAIKTRKTVQPAGDDDDDEEEAAAGSSGGGRGNTRAARRRSAQLRELYDSLAREAAAGGGGGGSSTTSSGRRPCASLAPEDLAETEWFYLMCASYCFPPGVGLPGKVFEMRRHVWLTGANQVDSKVFLRAILARSAGIQTVACIPVADDGVLEIGTTEKVEEDVGLIQRARSMFMDQLHGSSHTAVPTLSGHSTSSPITYVEDDSSLLQMRRRERYMVGSREAQQPPPRNLLNRPEDYCKRISEIEEEEDEEDDGLDDMECAFSDLEASHNERHRHAPNAEAGSSSQLEHREQVSDCRGRCSRYVDCPETDVQMGCPQNAEHAQETASLDQGQSNGPAAGQWDLLLYENLFSGNLDPSSAAEEDQAMVIPPENAHYAETVLRILRYNVGRQTAPSSLIKTYLTPSSRSSFARWNAKRPAVGLGLNESVMTAVSAADEFCSATPQRTLKAVLFIAGSRRLFYKQYVREAAESPADEPTSCRDRGGEGATSTSRAARCRGQQTQTTRSQAEVSASHVVKERRRREKLNERFVVLRSLVPFVTKMDRASILGDTIEYLKQLRRRIQDLESSSRSSSSRQTIVGGNVKAAATSTPETRGYFTRRSTGTTMLEASPLSCSSSSSSACGTMAAASCATEVQVSIIESDALLELRCPHRDGLLLRVMQAVHRDLRLEVTSVQASSNGGVLLAELRAKVNEVNGRRSSIAEVKRAIHLVLSSD